MNRVLLPMMLALALALASAPWAQTPEQEQPPEFTGTFWECFHSRQMVVCTVDCEYTNYDRWRSPATRPPWECPNSDPRHDCGMKVCTSLEDCIAYLGYVPINYVPCHYNDLENCLPQARAAIGSVACPPISPYYKPPETLPPVSDAEVSVAPSSKTHSDTKAVTAGIAAFATVKFLTWLTPVLPVGMSLHPRANVGFRNGTAFSTAGLSAEWRNWHLSAASSHRGKGWTRPSGRLDYRVEWEF